MLLTLIAFSLAAGGPELSGPRWDGQTYRRVTDEPSRLAFDVPLSQFLLEARHFEAKGKASHVLSLSGPSGVEVTVDVFDDSRDPGTFLSEVMPFLATEEASLASTVVARRFPALLIDHPRTGQSFARRTALFAWEGRVFRVTCLDAAAPRARKVFDRVLDSFTPTRETR